MRSFPVGGLVGWLGYTKLSDSQYGTSRTAPPAASRGGDGGRRGGKGKACDWDLGSSTQFELLSLVRILCSLITPIRFPGVWAHCGSDCPQIEHFDSPKGD